MAYVGNPIDTQNTFQSLVGKRFNGDGSTTNFTLDVAPSSTLDIEVFVGNVRQDPNSAYTLSGTTLTFTGAPPSGTNNIYVVHQAKSVGTIGIPDDTISARTLVTADSSADHVIIEDATDGELKKALYPSGFDVSSITGATALTTQPAATALTSTRKQSSPGGSWEPTVAHMTLSWHYHWRSQSPPWPTRRYPGTIIGDRRAHCGPHDASLVLLLEIAELTYLAPSYLEPA